MPNSETAHAGLVASAWRWLEHHLGPVDELSRLSEQDLRMMSEDLGMTVGDLQAVAASTVDIQPELNAMMRAAGLDPNQVQAHFHTIMRDIQVTCIRCTNRTLCARELAAGRAGATYHAFCGNASSFDGIRQEQAGR